MPSSLFECSSRERRGEKEGEREREKGLCLCERKKSKLHYMSGSAALTLLPLLLLDGPAAESADLVSLKEGRKERDGRELGRSRQRRIVQFLGLSFLRVRPTRMREHLLYTTTSGGPASRSLSPSASEGVLKIALGLSRPSASGRPGH